MGVFGKLVAGGGIALAGFIAKTFSQIRKSQIAGKALHFSSPMLSPLRTSPT